MTAVRSVIAICLLTAVFGCSDSARPPASAPPSTSEATDIAAAPEADNGDDLSFDFFASGNMWPAFAPKKPLTIQDVKAMQAQLASLSAMSAGRDKSKKDPRFAMLAPLLFGAKHLFESAPLSDEDKQLAVALASVLATTFDKSDLKIEDDSDVAITSGLQRIREWFNTLRHDNTTLASMIATMDDGPFTGKKSPDESLDGWEPLGEAKLPNGNGVVLLRLRQSADTKKKEEQGGIRLLGDHGDSRLVLQHKDASGKIRWTRQITADDPEDTVGKPAGFGKTPVERFPGYGFKLNMFANWTYGTERMTVYLNDDATLRFYFLSW